MRYIITAAPGPDYDAEAQAKKPFDETLFKAYMKFNEDMHNAGVLVASEGINPGKKAAQVRVVNGKRVVVDGPFAESKELVGGFYLIEVPSIDEAIQWAMRAPVGMGTDEVLTILPMTEADDLPPELVKMIHEAAPRWSEAFHRRA